MAKKTTSYRARLMESLTDPEEAANYLNAAREDSPEMFRKALLDVTQAQRVAKVAKKAGVQRESLYKAFSLEGNPTLDTLDAVFGVLGLELKVVTKSVSSYRSASSVPRQYYRAAKRAVRKHSK